MLQRIIAVVLFSVALATPAVADEGRGNRAGYQRTGTVDDIRFEENLIVIDDIPYRLSETLAVHSLTAKGISRLRVRAGIKVGYRLAGSDTISTLWILPDTYDLRRRR